MKKIALLIISNLLVITLFGQLFTDGLPHPYEPDEAHYTPNANEQFQLKQAEKLKLDSAIFDAYDADLEQWYPSGKYEYTYDDNENLTLNQYFTKDSYNQQWELDSQFEYAYDSDGNRTLYMRSTWDTNTQQWTPSFSLEYTYDNDARLITRLFSTLDNYTQQLRPDSKDEYTYDGSDEPTQNLHSRWYVDTQQWLPWYLYEYTYDDGQLMSRLRSAWDPNNQQWDPDTKYDYTYDNEEDLVEYLISSWNNSSGAWILLQKYDYTFDSNRNLITNLSSDWNVAAQQWIPEQVFEFTYDNSYTSEDLIIHFSELHTRHKILGYIYKFWDENAQVWDNFQRGTYHFSEQTVGITTATEAGIEIFPNPTNDFINFDIENTNTTTVQLYDAQGKHIRTQALAQNNQLSVRHLDSGTYFYQLLHEGEIYGGKFIVK